MLVLSRKVGEQIVIGDNITVIVNKISGNRISLGIEAPHDVRIVRGELKGAVEAFEDGDVDGEPLPLAAMPTFDFVADAVLHRAR
ncbi:MAG: carbon storage regulator [Planctomycetaceae bacterium]|nr:carbon storage regulator [Planctomycetaceae bacterium]